MLLCSKISEVFFIKLRLMYNWSHRMLPVHLCIKTPVEEIIFSKENKMSMHSQIKL